MSVKEWRPNRRKVLAGMAGAVAVAATRPAFAQNDKKPIRIGGTLALTGPLAPTAAIHRVAGELYVEDLNRRGGLLGRPVEWVLLDDQTRPDLARSLYERLITSDNVDLLVGPYGTSAVLAAMGVAQRHNKMLTQGTMGLPHLAKYKWIFPTSPIGPYPNREMPPVLLDMVGKAGKPPQSVAILTSKFPSAQYIMGGLREEVKKRGLKEALYLEYEFGTRDFSPIAARAREANADLVAIGSLGLDSNQLLEAMAKLDYRPPLHFHLFPAPGPLAFSPYGENALSYTFMEEHAPFMQKPEEQTFLKEYQERAKAANIRYTAFDFQPASMVAQFQLIEQAAKATESIEDAKLAGWLLENEVDTMIGPLNFKGEFNHGASRQLIRQVQDKRWYVVAPDDFAAPGVKPILPT